MQPMVDYICPHPESVLSRGGASCSDCFSGCGWGSSDGFEVKEGADEGSSLMGGATSVSDLDGVFFRTGLMIAGWVGSSGGV